MLRQSFPDLHRVYRTLLIDNIVPYWLRHGIDASRGGVFTCIRDDGSQISTNKFMWSQCRAIWTFAALYQRVEKRPEFLRIAQDTAEFVLRHGRDAQGRFAFEVSRDGEHLQGPISIYSDFFAIYGLNELFQATGEKRYLAEALGIFRTVLPRLADPNFDAVAPWSREEKVSRIHGIPMIGLETGQELAISAPEAEDVRQFVDDCLHQIMDHHVRPERQLLLENLDAQNQEIDSPAGRAVLPGHAIESMWFVLHQAERRKDPALIGRAVEVIRWMLEKGWDEEKGGLYLAIDAEGGVPWWKNADRKLWWPHCEALYALLLAYYLTGESWCLEWHARIHDWSSRHFSDHQNGEWHQRLDRDGNVIDQVVALPVKDPFHLPRSLILSVAVLEKLQGGTR